MIKENIIWIVFFLAICLFVVIIRKRSTNHYEGWISRRYLRANNGRFLKFLNFISVAGIAIGVASLIIVLSVMTGFGNIWREKILGTTPHIIIAKENGIKNYEKMIGEISLRKEVKAIAPYIHENIFLETAGQARSILIRAIDPKREAGVTNANKFITEGNFSLLSDYTVIIGSELSRYFGYSVGDEINLISPGSGIAGQKWKFKLKIVGIFSVGMEDYDMNVVLVNIPTAQSMFNLPKDVVTEIGIRLDNENKLDDFKNKLKSYYGYQYIIKTWIDSHKNLFDALKLEKWGLFLILVMIVLVASFNIISTLIVTVTSKIHDIGILKSIGVSRGSISNIFIKQGINIGLRGIAWGVIIGLGICYVLRTYIKVPEKIYFTGTVPVDIQLFDVMVIVGATFLICLIATIYPSLKAASLEPVEALRYE